MNAKRKKVNTTASPLEIPPRVITTAIEPETIRLPKTGELDPHFGLTRSALNELVLPTPRNSFKPPVKSFVLRQRGAKTGIRLVSYDSLRSYILARPENGEAA
jgi:hypothetical protein